jgi:hypothetical protein
MLYFIFSKLNAIILAIWVLFLLIVAIRFFSPIWINSRINFLDKIIKAIKEVPYKRLIAIAIAINVLYGLFVTWGQYYVWVHAQDFTKALVNLPLPKEVPLPHILEWTRSLFEHNFGFFLYYVLGRIWLYVFVLFLTSGILYSILKIWKSYRGNFSENGPELFLILMLIVGWPGIVVFIPIGFIFSLLMFSFCFYKGKRTLEIESAFIVASLFVLIFGKIILSFL